MRAACLSPQDRQRDALVVGRSFSTVSGPSRCPSTLLIEHDERLILVDTGESARALARGYFPWWSPFFHLSIDIHVEPEDEIGPRLRSMGIDPGKDLRMVVLTHLHHDHADGLSYLRDTDILVSTENYQAGQGVKGALLAANPSHFPSWFELRQTERAGPAYRPSIAPCP
jgi:N-acyl homoserine lactone hydrolase